MTEHDLRFAGVPAGWVACLRCRRLFDQEQYVATPHCLDTCTFCGEVREPIHRCQWDDLVLDAENREIDKGA